MFQIPVQTVEHLSKNSKSIGLYANEKDISKNIFNRKFKTLYVIHMYVIVLLILLIYSGHIPLFTTI